MTDRLRETLNLPPEEDDTVEEMLDRGDPDDLNYVKNNIRELLDSGSLSLKVLTKFAKNSESPRAFEAISTLIKTLLDANKEYHSITKPTTEDEGGPKQIEQKDKPRVLTFDPSILGKEDDDA